MQICDVCDLHVQGVGTRHYECNKAVEAGEPIPEVRRRRRVEWLQQADEDLYGAANANISVAGWQCVFLMIAGAALGSLFGRDIVSLITTVVGAVAGLICGISLYWQRKVQSLTARRIHLLWRERQSVD